ncbi:MAG: efflux RND transporter periplasmic adaptor subunit [Nitrospira sp.]|nr:efflux RND transporter periplasmic adaptor subunit [Nitrospira sp.]MDH4249903.1 efflux RND transporter periplasmic adaptor subunit [Nitrospira sp.]MDH4343982.1 efflux RND transporter periplasmic adaptor subunit [Nitrospira sp.]MDH5336510.1 efflux RND transporter periplasmic adaptor subunit [Nitrospira sp.]
MFIAVLLLAGCGSKEEPTTTVVSAAPQKTIQAAVVETKSTSVPIRVEVTGQVAPIFQATLSSRIQGTIDKLLVREGSRVSKGQLLIQLDSRDLQADLARAHAEVENAKAHLDRMNQLYAQDAVSKQEMENATRAYRVAEASRRAVEAQLSYTMVRAPFEGVITEKKVEAGELASPGQPLLKMEDPLHLRLEATVAEGDLKSVSRGDKIPVVIDALGGQALTGLVSQILPAGNPQTHTFMVKVDLPKTPGLKTGMFGRFQLDKGLTQTILVPSAAVVERGELSSLYVVGSDQTARLRWVKLGRRFEQQVEILSGLNIGERVLVDGSRGVDGAAVQIVEMVASPAGKTP